MKHFKLKEFECKCGCESNESPTSSHIKGIAVDIAFGNGTDLAIIMGALVGADFERFGINFDKHFLHVDSDKNKTFPTIWGY